MKDTLVKDAFRKPMPLLAVRVPVAKTKSAMKALMAKKALLDLTAVRSVVSDRSDPQADRLLLLRMSDEAELTPDVREYLEAESFELTSYTLELGYDHWSTDEILHAILPEELCDGSPSGFSTTGHIAHMNINEKYLPYKHIIGQVVLDKNKPLRTVVNKLDTIDTQFRFFKMELLAGEPDYIVEHHESDCRFTFDFKQVYWNSRLHTEHGRLVQSFKPEEVVADVFAGVGPFVVPAAKKGCAVFANDLNPSSVKYLTKNVTDNRVEDLVRVTCEDGRDFIKAVVARSLREPFPAYTGPKLSIRQQQKLRRERAKNRSPSPSPAPLTQQSRQRISHFVMNLPDSAITFLDAFRGVLSPAIGLLGRNGMNHVYPSMPMIHCYCFTREIEPDKAEFDIRMRVEKILGHILDDDASLHLVRSVAPNKNMYCISFRLPRTVAFSPSRDE
jgi:tRNA (guanine37-N1)-methyltransferase